MVSVLVSMRLLERMHMSTARGHHWTCSGAFKWSLHHLL